MNRVRKLDDHDVGPNLLPLNCSLGAQGNRDTMREPSSKAFPVETLTPVNQLDDTDHTRWRK